MTDRNLFLPVNMQDVRARGWSEVDFVYVSGDAYVDHPSFGAAIITRVLEKMGFRVAFLSQPDYKSCDDFKRFGRPRLGFMVSSGNIDSMVAHYTVSKKKRSYDYYTAGGKMGARPDRAVIVYCNRIREAYGDIPIVIGGLEASLRRFAHYDYWDDKVRRSILVDSRADILTYGMGENIIRRIAEAFLLRRYVTCADACTLQREMIRYSSTRLRSVTTIRSKRISPLMQRRLQFSIKTPIRYRVRR